MRHVRHSAAAHPATTHPGRIHELQYGPEPDHKDRRKLHNSNENADKQRLYPGPGEEDDIRSHHSRHGTAGPDRRYLRIRSSQDMCRCRRDPASKIKSNKPKPPENVFDVVPEYPEKQHVSANVKPIG